MKIRRDDIIFALFCIMTAVVFASYRCLVGDFVAYNGDFQNYNIFRRLLDGQVQYRDFTNYLGNGMVFINLPLLFLFRSFGASVFITNFTASILYSLIIFISFYTIIRNRKKAYAIAGLTAVSAFVILHAGFQGPFYYDYVYDVVFFEELGHSMRTTRAFLPFMLVGIFYVVKNIVKKEDLFWNLLCSKRLIVPVFFVSGFLTVWSNDFGYASVGCLFIILVLLNIFGGNCRFHERLLRYATALLSTVAGALLSITIITHGNIKDYVTTSMGVADYQFWYYGYVYGKYMTIADLFSDSGFTMLTVIFFFHAVCFLIKVIRGRADDDSICKLFLHSACYGAALIYVVGSGSHNDTPVRIVTYIFALEWIWKGIRRICLIEKFKRVRTVRRVFCKRFRVIYANRRALYIFIMLFLYCISVNMLRKNITYRNKEEIKGLGVNSVIGSGLDEYAGKFVDGSLFSTYAGAMETVNDIFQPTGTDYIIHVLGDEQRQRYLDNFLQNEYPYASTLKNEYTQWEYWASRANWFFYRELLLYYEPVRETNYSVIWGRTGKENTVETEVCLSWEYMNESTCRIDLELPDYEDGAYVDLYLKYDAVWTQDRLRCGGLRKVLCVQDGGEQYNNYGGNACYYLREKSDGCHIPVHIRNGKGYAYISSYPLSCTKLENVAVSVEKVIKEPVYALHVTNYTDLNRFVSVNSVSQDGMLLKFDNTEFIYGRLENAGQIRSGNEIGVVNSVWRDGNYIYVSLQNEINSRKFVYPNELEVVKKEKTYMTVNLTDDEWIGGISRKGGRILISEEIDVEGLYAVKADGITKKVKKTEMTKQGYCLSLEDNAGIQIFAYPQEFKLIYR
ncbi:MAG: hypothetical protein HFI59_00670 [Lachnospiraceae bacterium]|nr:hypothetical protein [Lachnospiraceae bacterium]